MASKTHAESENVIPVNEDEWETLVEEFGETWAPENSGDELIGTYTGTKMLEQTDFATGEIREVQVYELVDRSDKKWSVWSSYNVDIAFAEVGVGDLVKLIYLGTEPLKSGRSVKKYRIYRKSGS